MTRQHSFKPKLLVAAIGMALSTQALGVTYIVASNADSGAGSLRSALAAADSDPGVDFIQFIDGLGPIKLDTPLVVQDSVTIFGPVAGQILDGQGITQIIRFTGKAGRELKLERLILQNGASSEPAAAPPCSAADGRGGALCAIGNLTLDEVVVRQSSAAAASGGGIYVAPDSSEGVEIRNSVIEGNTVADFNKGGGISQAGGDLLLHNSVVSNNSAASGDGGGIHTDQADVRVIASTLHLNDAGYGGGLAATDGRVTITSSTLSGNVADRGGAGRVVNGLNNILIVGSTISQNTARRTNRVAGLEIVVPSGEQFLRISKSILADNTNEADASAANFGVSGLSGVLSEFSLASDSLLGDPAAALIPSETSISSDDPGLIALGNFDCAQVAGIGEFKQCVPVHGLEATSVAIDSGGVATLEFDQRGLDFDRQVGSAQDIGAFELQPPPALIVSNTDDSGPGSLRAMVDRANVTPGIFETVGFEPGFGEIVLATGQVEVADTVRIVGPAGGQAISGNSWSRVFGAIAPGTDLHLENLALRNGHADRIVGVFLSICSEGTGRGGALCANGDVSLTSSSIRNSVSGDRGGGLFVNDQLTMTDSIVSGNASTGDLASGGGIAVYGTSEITNSWIHGNETAGQYSGGGGIISFGTLMIDRSTISGNTTLGADSRGGGLYLLGNTDLINSTVSGNQATGDPDLLDSAGGGIFASASAISIRNSTITANTSTSGTDGLEVVREDNGQAYELLLESVILAGNGNDNFDAGNNADPNTGIRVVANASVDGDGDFPVGDPMNIVASNPQLEVLADNGCIVPAGSPLAGDSSCVQTHLPLPGSPVVNAGSNPAPELTSDQRGDGFTRTLGMRTDIGAIETDPVDPDPEPGPDLIFADGFET